jgi:hypothetical protein
MTGHDWLAERFEENRGHLRAVAYHMLGSVNEADDAIQEIWLRLSRSDTSAIENLGGWLTTVVARVWLDMLRSRTSRREESIDERVSEPVANRQAGNDPNVKRSSQIRSASLCSWYLTASFPPSASLSSCTICSICPSRKSPRLWGARPTPRGSSPAAHAASGF